MAGFNWKRAVERYGEELAAIAAGLIVMAGIQMGRTVETLPRHLYRRILSILRPAEYAARRLIVMAACKLVAVTMRPTGRRGRRPSNSVTLGLDPRAHSGDSAKPSKMKNAAASSIIGGALRLHGMGPRIILGFNPRTTDDARCEPPRPAVHTAPGIALSEKRPSFQLFDPWKRYGDPWLTADEIAALNDPGRNAGLSWQPPLPPDEPVGAKTLCRRIRALANAIQDIEAQAARLARWRARRLLDTARPKRWSPFRPSRPPGWKKKPKTAIGEVLKDCHMLALDAWDTRGPPASAAKLKGGTDNLARQQGQSPQLEGGTRTS